MRELSRGALLSVPFFALLTLFALPVLTQDGGATEDEATATQPDQFELRRALIDRIESAYAADDGQLLTAMELGYRDEAQRRKVRRAVWDALDGLETPTDFELAFVDVVRTTNPRFLPSLLAGVVEHREALQSPDNGLHSVTSAFGSPDGWENPMEEEQICPPGEEQNDRGECVLIVGVDLCEIYQDACDDTPEAPLQHDPNMCRPVGAWPECPGMAEALQGMIRALNECNANPQLGPGHPQCQEIAREKESTFKAYVCAGCSTAPPPDDYGPLNPPNPVN